MLYTGLDIGTGAIKFVKLKRTSNKYILLDYFYKELSFTSQTREEEKYDIIIQELKKINQTFKLDRTFLITAIPRYAVIIKDVFFPSKDPQEIKNMIQFEIEKQIPFPIEKAVSDYLIINNNIFNEEGQTQTEVCLIATKNETINRHLEILKAARLEPNVVSVSSLALTKALVDDWQSKGKEATPYVIINIGNQFTEVNLVYNNDLISSRSINSGGMHLSAAIQSVLSVDYMESEKLKREINEDVLPPEQISRLENIREEWLRELTNEIKLSLDLFRKERKGLEIKDILLTGGTSQLNGLKNYIAQNLNMNVEWANPLADVEGTIPQKELQMFSVSLGLALRDKSNLSGVNIIPKEIQKNQNSKKKRQKSVVYITLIIVIIGFILGIKFNKIARAKMELNKINQKIMNIDPLIREVKIMKEQMDKLRKSIIGSTSPLDILREVTVVCPANIYLTNFSYEKDNITELKGRTLSHSDVSKFSIALGESPYFGKVEIKRSEANTYSGINLVDFEIVCYSEGYVRK